MRNVVEETNKCLEWTVSRNVDTEDAAGASAEGIEHYRENLNCFRKSLNHHEQIVIRNLGFKNTPGEDSKGSAKHVIGIAGRRKILM